MEKKAMTLREATATALRAEGISLLSVPKRFVSTLCDLMDPKSPEVRLLVRVCNEDYLAPYTRSCAGPAAPDARELEAAALSATEYLLGMLIDREAASRVSWAIAWGVADAMGVVMPSEARPTMQVQEVPSRHQATSAVPATATPTATLTRTVVPVVTERVDDGSQRNKRPFAALAVVAIVIAAAIVAVFFLLGPNSLNVSDSVDNRIPDIASVKTKNSLSDYTWGELKAIANSIASAEDDIEAIEIAKRYHLVDAKGKLTGETKEMEVQGQGTAEVRIIGIRHDELADDSGMAGLTFEFANIVGTHGMNDSVTNEGGWEASAMRSWLNGDYLDALPSSVRDNIVEVCKATNNVGEVSDASLVSETGDKLWLLSVREVFGDAPSSQRTAVVYNAEGSQYKLYVDHGVTTKDFSFAQKTGSFSCWWLRSAHANETYTFRFVYGTGDWQYANSADGSYGVSPGFCF